jgi:hypothetical protein
MMTKFSQDIATVQKFTTSGPVVNLEIIAFELNSHYPGHQPYAIK